MRWFLTALLFFSLVITCYLGHIAWEQFDELNRLKMALASAKTKASEELRHSLADLQRRKMTNDKRIGEVPSRQKGSSDRRMSMIERSQEDIRVLRNSPEYAPFWRQQLGRHVQERYGPLFEQLKLSPEKLDQLKNLLVEKYDSITDASELALRQGFDARAGETKAVIAYADMSVDNDIESLLGENNFKLYMSYNSSMPYRGEVDAFQTSLTGQGSVPMQPDQIAAMVNALSQAGGDSNLSAQAQQQISALLTPQQLRAFTQWQQQRAAQMQLLRKITSPTLTNNNQSTVSK